METAHREFKLDAAPTRLIRKIGANSGGLPSPAGAPLPLAGWLSTPRGASV